MIPGFGLSEQSDHKVQKPWYHLYAEPWCHYHTEHCNGQEPLPGPLEALGTSLLLEPLDDTWMEGAPGPELVVVPELHSLRLQPPEHGGAGALTCRHLCLHLQC